MNFCSARTGASSRGSVKTTCTCAGVAADVRRSSVPRAAVWTLRVAPVAAGVARESVATRSGCTRRDDRRVRQRNGPQHFHMLPTEPGADFCLEKSSSWRC